MFLQTWMPATEREKSEHLDAYLLSGTWSDFYNLTFEIKWMFVPHMPRYLALIETVFG